MSARWVPLSCIVAALILGAWSRWDALGSGFWSDDYLHRAMLEGRYPVSRTSFDLFRFDDGTAADQKALVDYGYYPWWTHPQFRLAMLRPLPSLLHAADHALFRSSAFAQHLHSLLWWALGVGAVALLLFASLPRLAAAIAVVFFALDESHTVPLVWISNRSLLIATAFGALALFAHVRHRQGGAGRFRSLSIASFSAALLSGEYALSMLAYLLGFELFSRDDARTRVRALLPFVALALVFLVAWAALGYGTAHSGLYTNPLQSPSAYLGKVVTGVPVLLGDLVLGVPADYFTFGAPWAVPSWRAVQVGLSLLGVVLALWLLLRTRARIDEPHARALGWLCTGAVLGLLPVLGSFVTTRLVLCSSVGAAALFGSVLYESVTSARAKGLRAFVSVALGGLVLLAHGFGALVAARAGSHFYAAIARARTQAALAAPIDDASVSGQRIVLITAADVNDVAYLPFVRFAHGHPLAKGFRLLSASPGAHELARVDERTLEVQVLEEAVRGEVLGSLTRATRDRFRTNAPIELAGLRVQVLATKRGQPLRTRFTFDVPLEDPSLVWLRATERGFERFEPPPPGTGVILPPPVSPDVVFGSK